ncbi:MAG: c-type cytochrome biogenesis protein CcmI, partial [Rhodospirillales bacterium]|nr:c-type cytochrome biogenesis protein CcmI [Rhodospirillales bacterium]
MTIWIAAGLLIIGVLVLLILPLFREAASEGGYDDNVYADQLREIESDRARGLMDDEGARQLTSEIERRRLRGDNDGESAKSSAGGPIIAAIIGAVFVPALSFALYNQLGAPEIPDRPHAKRAQPADPSENRVAMQKLVDQLAARMQQSPERLEGWLLLARSLADLGNFKDATKAYRRAIKLAPARADIRTDLGEMIFLGADRKFTAPARAEIAAALKLNPTYPKALFYLGMDQRHSGDNAAAVQTMKKLIAVSPPDAPWLAGVNKQLSEAAEAANIDLGVAKPAPPPPPGPT